MWPNSAYWTDFSDFGRVKFGDLGDAHFLINRQNFRVGREIWAEFRPLRADSLKNVWLFHTEQHCNDSKLLDFRFLVCFKFSIVCKPCFEETL